VPGLKPQFYSMAIGGAKAPRFHRGKRGFLEERVVSLCRGKSPSFIKRAGTRGAKSPALPPGKAKKSPALPRGAPDI